MNAEELAAVDRLLALYDKYRRIAEAERAVATRLARAKLAGDRSPEPTTELVQKRAWLIERLRQLADRMTFDSPLIWIAYKYRAYRDEAQPILTMHDLRQHCGVADAICGRRFAFLDEQLVTRGHASLADPYAYPDELPLDEVLRSEAIAAVTCDPEFAAEWVRHEHHTDDGRVAKWEDYVPGRALARSAQG